MISKKLIIKGLASQKNNEIEIDQEDDLNDSLLNFLMEKKVTIASSCAGAGTCKKCVINSTILSCQISLREFLEENMDVEISYL